MITLFLLYYNKKGDHMDFLFNKFSDTALKNTYFYLLV